MAGERPTSFTPSIYKGSEEVVECPCTPCGKEGTAVEAVNLCTDCSEFFCLGCTKHHLKFGITASHNVVDRTEADHAGRGKNSLAQLPTERCRDHHGELITSFCRDHDVVVCNSCATMDHRTIDNMAYIPKISGDSNTRQAAPLVNAEISASLKATRAVKLHVQEHQTMADDERANQQTIIKANTERLMAHAQDMEKAALADVTRHHQEASAKISAELAQLNDTEAALERRQRNLDNAQTNCDSQVFVDTKLGSREAEAARQLEQRLASTSTGNVRSKFVVDDRIDVVLSDVNSLGKVVEYKPYKAVLKGTYNVGMKKDMKVSCIGDACELAGGEILIADFDNNCIKTLGESYKVVKRFKMQSEPWGICQTRPSEIAVTMHYDRKVQFVDISGSWKPATSFTTEEKCRGIAYCRDELLVSCGGHPGTKSHAPEGSGFVAMFDLSGSLRRKIQLDGHGNQIFSIPYHIVTTNSDNSIHVVDKKNGVITVDRKGSIKSIFHENIQKCVGSCAIDDENLIVCGMESGNVLQVTTDGKLITELLSKTDMIKKPCFAMYSRVKSTLMITFDRSNEIKLFKLHI